MDNSVVGLEPTLRGRPATEPNYVMPLRVVTLAVAFLVTALSVVCWITTLDQFGRFIFLPGGDVGLGFYSQGGYLSWIEYAPWDQRSMHYPWWSLHWGFIIALELIITVVLAMWVMGGRWHNQPLQLTSDARES